MLDMDTAVTTATAVGDTHEHCREDQGECKEHDVILDEKLRRIPVHRLPRYM